MEVDRDKLTARWRAIEVRLNQIAAAPGLDRELCRSEVESLLTEQSHIEFVLDRPGDTAARRWARMW